MKTVIVALLLLPLTAICQRSFLSPAYHNALTQGDIRGHGVGLVPALQFERVIDGRILFTAGAQWVFFRKSKFGFGDSGQYYETITRQSIIPVYAGFKAYLSDNHPFFKKAFLSGQFGLNAWLLHTKFNGMPSNRTDWYGSIIPGLGVDIDHFQISIRQQVIVNTKSDNNLNTYTDLGFSYRIGLSGRD